MTRLTARLADLAGAQPRGATLVIAGPPVKNTAGKILHTGGRSVPFDTAGNLATDLLATNTPGTDPTTWAYAFTVAWDGGQLPTFTAQVTGDTIDLTELQPMDPTAPTYQPGGVALADVAGLEAELDDLRAGPWVQAPLLNGWTPYGGELGDHGVRYRTEGDTIRVELAVTGGADQSVICVLPSPPEAAHYPPVVTFGGVGILAHRGLASTADLVGTLTAGAGGTGLQAATFTYAPASA